MQNAVVDTLRQKQKAEIGIEAGGMKAPVDGEALPKFTSLK